MSLSTHVLDNTTGSPGAGMDVSLWFRDESGGTDSGDYVEQYRASTDADGRISGWTVHEGTYRLVFATGDWWARRDIATFHPEAVVTFTVTEPDSHHHVPLLLSPYAYSTYRGS